VLVGVGVGVFGIGVGVLVGVGVGVFGIGVGVLVGVGVGVFGIGVGVLVGVGVGVGCPQTRPIASSDPNRISVIVEAFRNIACSSLLDIAWLAELRQPNHPSSYPGLALKDNQSELPFCRRFARMHRVEHGTRLG